MASEAKHSTVPKGTIIGLPTAPSVLVVLHGRIGVGKDILGRLLTDRRMRRSWTTLSRHISRDAQWEQLWREIVYALMSAKKQKRGRRIKTRDSYLRIMRASRALATSIENGPLDLLAYEVFPEDVMRINRVPDWKILDSLGRSQEAFRLLRDWPSVPEMLRELATRATVLATQAMRNPALVDHLTRDSSTIAFARALADYFSARFEQPLYGTVSRIASVVFDREVSKSFVAQAVRRRKGRH